MSDKEDKEDASSGQEIYEVERIVKKKIDSEGKVEYYIKWKDYPGRLCFVVLVFTRFLASNHLSLSLPPAQKRPKTPG